MLDASSFKEELTPWLRSTFTYLVNNPNRDFATVLAITDDDYEAALQDKDVTPIKQKLRVVFDPEPDIPRYGNTQEFL